MKIATSASFYNCPAVQDILMSCDVVYTSNDYALANFNHPNIKHIGFKPEEFGPDDEVVTYSDLHFAFYKWVANTATDNELYEWSSYFASPPEKTKHIQSIRAEAKAYISIREQRHVTEKPRKNH